MTKLLLLVLIIGVGAAAYFTRPDEPTMRAAAGEALQDPQSVTEGLQGIGAALAGDRVFNDYYVVTKYAVVLDDKAVVECWGGFTKVKCDRKAA
jgi:hypothetical protein